MADNPQTTNQEKLIIALAAYIEAEGLEEGQWFHFDSFVKNDKGTIILNGVRFERVFRP